MALYEYRCERDGVFEITRRLGTAPESVACPVCNGESQRIVSIPTIRCGSRPAWMAAIDHAEKSRHAPEVVTTLPSTGGPVRPRVLPLTPTLARLPRP